MPFHAQPVESRFWAKVDKDAEGGCWLWTGSATTAPGANLTYGVFWLDGQNRRAHRVSLALAGRQPKGDQQVDHLCRNTLCVNPDHLEWVDAGTNVRRSANACANNARKTHCPRGHALSGENLYVNPSGQRCCRACRRDQMRRYRAKAQEGSR